MKSKINYFLKLLIFLFFIKNFESQTTNQATWNEESLLIYIEKNFLQSNEQTKNDFQYLLIDPDQSLNEQSKNSIQIILNSIRKEYNINNILILLKSTDNSFDKKNLENLVIKITAKLNIDSENLISTLISINEPKIIIIKGSNLKEKISDNKIDNLIQNLEKNIKTENKSEISRIIVDYYENIINILRTNNKNSKNFIWQYKGIIIFIILIIIIIILIKNFSGESTDLLNIIAQKENKIVSFLENNKSLSIKEMTNKACIICLENYNKNGKRRNSESTPDSMPHNQGRKSSIDSTDRVVEISDKIHLPCKHNFHETCLMKWKVYDCKCPLCKSVIVFDNNSKMKINKFYPNKNWILNEASKFRLAIEDFMRIQKIFYPHIIQNAFVKKIIDTYKVKFDKEPVVICVSPETLICKTLPSEDRNVSKYDKLDYSTQTSADEKRTGNQKEIIKDL